MTDILLQKLIDVCKRDLFKARSFFAFVVCMLMLGNISFVFAQTKVFENFEGSVRRGFAGGGTVTSQVETDDVPLTDGGDFARSITVTTGTEAVFFGGLSLFRPTPLPSDTNDTFNMWIKADPAETLAVNIELHDDDDNDNIFDPGLDDSFVHTLSLNAGAGYQLVSIPYKNFSDASFGSGNNKFDPEAGGNGTLVEIVLTVTVANGTPPATTFNLLVDYIHFKSEDDLLKVYENFEGAISVFDSKGDPGVGDANLEHSRTAATRPDGGGDFAEQIDLETRTDDGGSQDFSGMSVLPY